MTKSVFSPQYMLFLRLLAEARLKAGLTQVELASLLGRPRNFVWKYENGERRLDIVEFLSIAKTLRLNPHELIDEILEVPLTDQPHSG